MPNCVTNIVSDALIHWEHVRGEVASKANSKAVDLHAESPQAKVMLSCAARLKEVCLSPSA